MCAAEIRRVSVGAVHPIDVRTEGVVAAVTCTPFHPRLKEGRIRHSHRDASHVAGNCCDQSDQSRLVPSEGLGARGNRTQPSALHPPCTWCRTAGSIHLMFARVMWFNKPMTHVQHPLSGAWNLRGTSPDGLDRLELSASVPGHVHGDLIRHALLPDPFWRDNAERCQWVETWKWQYARAFKWDGARDQSWAELVFEGLDTYAEVRLNGDVIGQCANMHIPHRFDVSGRLRDGYNHVQVSFTPVAEATADKEFNRYFSCFSTDRVHTRRMQCTFAWDWVHRFVSYGIWQPVWLNVWDRARVSDQFIQTCRIDADRALLVNTYTVEARSDGPLRAEWRLTDPDGAVVWNDRRAVCAGTAAVECTVSHPRLWWPAGYGDQPMYAMEMRLFAADETLLHVHTQPFGIRTVRLEQTVDAPGSPEERLTRQIRKRTPNDRNDQPGRGFAIWVNDVRIFCKGGNWVPCDPFPGRITANQYDRLIRLAREGHMNCMRSWGGGLYEPEPFWQACDRHGVMITQDMALACAQYPEDDPEFLEALRCEFPLAVRRLRNHPSLILWAGDNELAMNNDEDDLTGSGVTVAREISGPTIQSLDPTRPFVPTSPYGGRPNNTPTIGDCHISAWYHPQWLIDGIDDYRQRIDGTLGRFISEYALPGAPPMRSLRKFLSEDDIADPAGLMWDYHTKDNPYNGMTDPRWTHFHLLERTADHLFGASTTPDERVRHMEYVPYEWIRLQMEAVRRHKGYCDGLLLWMYNDCWPASGWSIVDYYGFPKAGWFAMKSRCAPVIVSIEETAGAYHLWLCSDARWECAGNVRVWVQPWQGGALWSREWTAAAAANQTTHVGEIARAELDGLLTDQTVLVAEWTGDTCADRAVLYASVPRHMQLPVTMLTMSVDGDHRSGNVHVQTDHYARVVTLEADCDLDFSDNYFDMLPGEQRTVRWRNPSAREDDTPKVIPHIRAVCWNGAR